MTGRPWSRVAASNTLTPRLCAATSLTVIRSRYSRAPSSITSAPPCSSWRCAAKRAAPSATASSGRTEVSGALPKMSWTSSRTAGIRVEPPTASTTPTSVKKGLPAHLDPEGEAGRLQRGRGPLT